jgi:hypothetical protein
MQGLIIKPEFIALMLSGKKTWEMRSRVTKKRGTVAVIEAGSKLVVATCNILDSFGPLSRDDLVDKINYHGIEGSDIDTLLVDRWNCVWVMGSIKKLEKPVQYEHPSGAVVWVNLEESVADQIRGSL